MSLKFIQRMVKWVRNLLGGDDEVVRNLFRGDGKVGLKFIHRGWRGGFEIYSHGIMRWVRNLFRGDGEVGLKFIYRGWSGGF